MSTPAPAQKDSLSAIMIELQDRFAPLLVLLYLLLALMVFAVTPILFITAVRTPFIGAFIEHTLMVNTTRSTAPGTWDDSLDLGEFGYQIQSIAGQRITNTLEMRQQLQRFKVGDEVDVDLLSPEAKPVVVTARLVSLPMPDRLSFFVIPYVTGLVYLLCGLYVFGIRRYDPAGRAFALFTASVGIALAALFDNYSTNYLTAIWSFSLGMVGGSLINLALLFPESVRLVARYPALGWIGYVGAILMGAFAWYTIYNFDFPVLYVVAWRIEFIYIALAVVFFLTLVAYRWLRAISPVVREQARLIFWGALFSFAPLGFWLVLTTFNPSLSFNSFLLLPLVLFPVFTGYAIMRYRLVRTDYLFSQAVLYALMGGIAVGGYALLVAGLSLVIGDHLSATSPVLIGLMVFLLALVLNPLRNLLQGVVDRYFFRGQIVYRDRQQAFARELTQAMDLNQILSVLRSYIEQAFQPAILHIYVYDIFSGQYLAADQGDGKPTSDVRFPAQSALVQLLIKQREARFFADLTNLPEMLQADQARINLLAATLFVPLPGRDRLIGWAALGTRRSGEPYSSRDMDFLESLSDQAALAVERAQVVADLERRVREMNVLTRVAQGVSFTLAFDDILELISAQTGQVMPARDFRVSLYDNETEVLVHAFYLEDDERMHQFENRPLPSGRGLEAEIITSQRPLITDDFERECRRRGMMPDVQGIYAWMGVPLNAGAQTIGVLSVASRDPAVVYTPEQRGLLQAIADQASGAIVKARSLEESERRARQLAKLNEIGIGLTSTLELRPLLNQILDSATGILSCEAGSLFLVDSQTDELVFEVVLGPVAGNLLGRRLPPGAGLVGEAVQFGRPIIANDAKRRKEWFDKTDAQTGFDTQDLLVVPMRYQDRIIGVIEVINKSNGSPFTRADQELLSAFTSQATIAIENARLYTMTDQALAARVEELSMMQRIDRELNAGLDIERAMRLTLDWAMRQSHAESGLVGTVDEPGVRVISAQGYTSELPDYPPLDQQARYYLPVLPAALQEAIESGQPRCLAVDPANVGQDFSLLQGAHLQIVIPIRRETVTIGVLMLESRKADDCPDELVNFLTRLSDHAAIAVANARLYEEVNEANLAKSRFVSFVAHELKNPMASIKGYTELVAGGMAGPVNEMQASFLGTVRSNVDRMNTIVSDLNDLTKIQTGNLRLEPKAIQTPEVLEDVVRSLRRQIDDKRQALQIDLPAELPPVWADSSRLAQVLTNLVSNATKYTPEDGRIFIGAERQVAKEGTLAGAMYVHLWVRDSGIGISEEDQKRIFQQYFRTDNAKEMASGTGLGLSITRSLIEMQGGRIWFDSAVGQGTTFHFTLPVAE